MKSVKSALKIKYSFQRKFTFRTFTGTGSASSFTSGLSSIIRPLLWWLSCTIWVIFILRSANLIINQTIRRRKSTTCETSIKNKSETMIKLWRYQLWHKAVRKQSEGKAIYPVHVHINILNDIFLVISDYWSSLALYFYTKNYDRLQQDD